MADSEPARFSRDDRTCFKLDPMGFEDMNNHRVLRPIAGSCGAGALAGQRVAHVRAFAAGLAAAEFEPAGKAAQEVAILYDWMTEATR